MLADGVIWTRRLPPESFGDAWADIGVPAWEELRHVSGIVREFVAAAQPFDHIVDVDFDDASDVGSIRYRLAPIDVGFDLRGEDMPVLVAWSPVLRVSYADVEGQRRVARGPFSLVVQHLHRLGFRITIQDQP